MNPALWLALALATASPPAPAEESHPGPAPRDLVVLVHGMGRTRASMRTLARALEDAGYEVARYGYHSRRLTVEQAGSDFARWLDQQAERPEVVRIHLVGHSLGNIVIRWALANHRPGKTGRVVMLAPPNRGARTADFAAPWLSWLSTPLPDLTTKPGSAARALPTPPGVPIGVIAGSRDYTVRPAETCLDGQTDHTLVPSGHTFIMRKRLVHELTIRFLRSGSFQSAAESPSPCPPSPSR